MPPLTEDYGIEEDSRYAQCNREAALSLALFLFSAVTSLIGAYALTAGRTVDEYGAILGMPSWLFISIVITFVVFLLAIAVSLRVVFRDVVLDETPLDSSHRVRQDRA